MCAHMEMTNSHMDHTQTSHALYKHHTQTSCTLTSVTHKPHTVYTCISHKLHTVHAYHTQLQLCTITTTARINGIGCKLSTSITQNGFGILIRSQCVYLFAGVCCIIVFCVYMHVCVCMCVCL